MLNGFLCFMGMLSLDLCYARYTQTITSKNLLGATLWSGVLVSLSIFVTTEFIKDIAMAPWVICGAMVGTYIAVRWE